VNKYFGAAMGLQPSTGADAGLHEAPNDFRLKNDHDFIMIMTRKLEKRT